MLLKISDEKFETLHECLIIAYGITGGAIIYKAINNFTTQINLFIVFFGILSFLLLYLGIISDERIKTMRLNNVMKQQQLKIKTLDLVIEKKRKQNSKRNSTQNIDYRLIEAER